MMIPLNNQIDKIVLKYPKTHISPIQYRKIVIMAKMIELQEINKPNFTVNLNGLSELESIMSIARLSNLFKL